MYQIIMGLLIGASVANFGEYWVHRMQHWKILRGKDHDDHHNLNIPRTGWLYEYWAYVRPASFFIVIIAILFYLTVGVGLCVGWMFGTLLHMAVMAYVHEMSHTNPSLFFGLNNQYTIFTTSIMCITTTLHSPILSGINFFGTYK